MSIGARLTRPLDAAALAAFRVASGVMVTVSAIRFLAYGWVDEFFVAPTFFFKHLGFSWVPVPAHVHALFVALIVLGVLVTIGLLYRCAVVLLFIGFTWVQLMDATNYLNHYYLVSVLLLLMATMPLGDVWGLDAVVRPRRRRTTLPAWMTWLLRFQVGCVYAFAGLAKLGGDWLLHAQPLGIWLTSRTTMPVIGPVLAQWWAPWLFSWCGFLFDSSVVVFLLWRRTRPLAYVVVVIFHSLTMILFPIGMFPVIMMVAAVVFFSPSWPRRFFTLAPASTTTTTTTKLTTTTTTLLACWCGFQLLMPLRGWLYGGDVRWHEQGMRFSWRVMVREKNGTVTFHVEDEATRRRWFVRPRDWLDARQAREMSTQPDLILQLAHAIAAAEREKGRDVHVRAEALVSLNGRPPALLIDPDVDLVDIVDGVRPASWILPRPDTPPAPTRR